MFGMHQGPLPSFPLRISLIFTSSFLRGAPSSGQPPARRRELQPADLLSEDQRESLADSFGAANVSGDGQLTQMELAMCVEGLLPLMFFGLQRLALYSYALLCCCGMLRLGRKSHPD